MKDSGLSDGSSLRDNPVLTQAAPSTPYALCLTQPKASGNSSAPAPVVMNRPAGTLPAVPPQTSPNVLPSAPPQQTLVVNLPPGVVAGHFLRAMGPDGVMFTFQAPVGSTPGCPVKVVLPNQTTVLSVRIPEGAQPGSEISALSPSGVVLRYLLNVH
jgi:hypothetical protein